MLYDYRRKKYGPEQVELRADEPTALVVASWGPTVRERSHTFFVRRVPVQPLRQRDTPDGYTWCRFPDGRDMLVRDSNIHARREKPQGESEQEAA